MAHVPGSVSAGGGTPRHLRFGDAERSILGPQGRDAGDREFTLSWGGEETAARQPEAPAFHPPHVLAVP